MSSAQDITLSPAPTAIALPTATPRAESSCYPIVRMRAYDAALDLLLVTLALLLAESFVGRAVDWLVNRWPDQGILLINTALGVASLLIIGIILLIRKQSLSSIGIRSASPGLIIGAWLAAIPACYIAMILMALLYAVVSHSIGGGLSIEEIAAEREEFFAMAPSPTLATFALFGLFTGIHEELLFRGFAMPRFIALFRSRTAGVILCAAVFGLLHSYQGTISIFQTAGLGLVFSLVALWTRTIWPAILAHALFNGINFSLIPLFKSMMPELMRELSSQPAM
ncbi:MAG: CPBP family intramembrane metalloprotease [Phycisphaerae bacterium]|nr:CPBP family intramembrane metalloprotease [Phycisphaerae bacterium]